MASKAWCLCFVDNFGEVDMQHLGGAYRTKKEAEAKLAELKRKFGPQGYVVRQVQAWYDAFHFPKKGGIT